MGFQKTIVSLPTHSFMDFPSDGGNLKLNLATKETILDFTGLHIGENTFGIDVSHIYSNECHISNCGMGNNWKLNLHQLVLPYSSSYSLDGFSNGNYVYVDGNNHIHKFVKCENKDNVYYDACGTGMKLIVNSNDYQISTPSRTLLNFNKDGLLIKIVNTGNPSIYEKILVYENNLISKVYDYRKPNNYIRFEYYDGLLNKMVSIIDGIEQEYIYYRYDDNQLIGIFHFTNNRFKHAAMYKYDSSSNMTLSTGTINGNALKLSYSENVIQIDKGICKIKKSSDNDYPKINECNSNQIYISEEDVYLGDDEYLFNLLDDDISEVNTYYYSDISNDNLYDQTVHTYSTSFSTLQNKGKTYRYFFNREKNITNVFEVVNNCLYSIKKEKGYCIMHEYNNSGLENINGKNVKSIYYDNTLNLLSSNDDEYSIRSGFINYRNNKSIKFTNFIIKLSIKHTSLNSSYIYVNANVGLKVNNNSYEYDNKVKIDHLAYNAWQDVEIPIQVDLNDYSEISYINISFTADGAGTYYITNSWIYEGNISYLSTNISSVNLKDVDHYCLNGNIDISSHYVTEADLVNSIINVEKGDNGFNDFIYDNGKKIIPYIETIDAVMVTNEEGVHIGGKRLSIGSLIYYTMGITNQLLGLKTYSLEGELIVENLNGRYGSNNSFGNKYIKYDRQGRLHYQSNFYGSYIEKIYDQYGNIISNSFKQANTLGIYELYIYDDETSEGKYKEKIIEVYTNGDRKYIIDSKTNGLTNYIEEVDTKNNTSNRFTYNYDNIDRVIKLNTNVSSNQFKYNDYGYLENVLDDGNSYIYGYDNYGNLSSIALNNENSNPVIIEENIVDYENNKITKSNNLLGSEIIYNYDDYGRIIRVVDNNNNTTNFTYQSHSDIINSNSYTDKVYNSEGFTPLKSIVDSNINREITYTFNDDNINNGYEVRDSGTLVMKKEVVGSDIVYTIGSTSYKYKTNYTPLVFEPKITNTYYTDSSNNTIDRFNYSYQYDIVVNGVSKRTSSLSEVNTNYRIDYQYSSGITSRQYKCDNIDYTYDYSYKDGMINNVLLTGNNSKSYGYTYDSNKRIIGETLYNGVNISYSYNKYNSLDSVVMSDGTNKSYTYDNLGRLTEYKKNNDIVNTITYSGSNLYPSSISGNTCIFNTFGGLVNYGQYTYEYDYNGLRTKKINGNHIVKYYYDNDKLIGEDHSNNIKIRYMYDLNTIAGARFIDSNGDVTDYEYIKDGLDNVVGIVKNTTIVATYEYDSWGNIIDYYEDSGDLFAQLNPIRYRGYYYDVETGFFWCNSRYYNPKWGRWISPDSIDNLNPTNINGLNLYSYCFNDPVNYKQCVASLQGSNMTSANSSISGFNGVGGNLGTGSSNIFISPWYVQMIAGAIPDLYTGGRYLAAKGMHQYFAYKKNYYYMFPILGKTHNRLAINSTNFGKMTSATFKELITGNSKAGIGSVIGNVAGTGLLTLGTNLFFNLCENGFDVTDGDMWIDTGIDTAIGMGAYGLSIGTASLATAGLAMAGVALPGVVVVGGAIVLSIGFEHLIRAISGYWD